jgi:hypothetical protein
MTQNFKLHKSGHPGPEFVDAEPEGNNQWMALCPFHKGDTDPSLSINSEMRVWHCFGCNAMGSLWDDSFEPIPKGLSHDEKVKRYKEQRDKNKRRENAKILATYDYLDENNTLLFQSVKMEAPPPDNKDFKQRRPDGKGGWIDSISGIRRVLYRLPELIEGDSDGPVFISEGEKDVDRLRELGCTATTNPMGAGKWKEEYNQYLKDREVIILADNDDPGRKHASNVAQSLYGIAKSIVVVHFPELREHGDVSDFLNDRKDQVDQGLYDLLNRIADAPEWKPEPQLGSDDYVFVDGNTIISVEETETEWFWDGIVPTSGMVLTLGKPKAGKTVLGVNFGVMASRGGILLGRAIRQGPVIYLALEEIRTEIRKYLLQMGGDFSNIHFHFGSAPQEALMKLIPHMEKLRPVLVVIDIMQRFLRLKKIEDYAEAITKMEPVISVARGLKCCIDLHHHSPKMEREIVDSGLGSIGFTGSVDTVILIRKEREEWRSIQTLQRYHKSGEKDIKGLVTSLADDGITLKIEGTRFEVEKAEIKRLIIEKLRQMKEQLTEPKVRELIKKDEGLTRECLTELVEEGKVERTGAGVRHSPFCFSILHSK